MLDLLSQFGQLIGIVQNNGGLMVLFTVFIFRMKAIELRIQNSETKCIEMTGIHEAIYHQIERRKK